MFIGLLMVADDSDILERTLAHNTEYVDCFYALDGTKGGPADAIAEHPKCDGFWTDADVPFDGPPRDGWRRLLHEAAVADHGPDNWFVLLHGDEVWTQDPRDIAVSSWVDAYVFQLPFFFPLAGEEWDYDVHPLDQLRWSLWPGWPECRMFRGAANVAYDPAQHFNAMPSGLILQAMTAATILHYPYRSPDVQRARAARHKRTGFDPDNFRHILDGDHVYWTADMIADYQQKDSFRELREGVAHGSLTGAV